MKIPNLLPWVIFFCTAWTGADASITYKWLDSDGNVTYSQTMPTGTQPVETLKWIAPATRKAAPPPLNRRQERLKYNCKVARYNKAVLQTPANVVVPDADGNDAVLSAEQKKRRLVEAINQIKIFCS